MDYLKGFFVAVVVSLACIVLPAHAENEVFDSTTASPEMVSGLVNINTATAEKLAMELKGVGVKRAQAIVAYREEKGPFSDVNQLQEIKGIGETVVLQNRDKIRL